MRFLGLGDSLCNGKPWIAKSNERVDSEREAYNLILNRSLQNEYSNTRAMNLSNLRKAWELDQRMTRKKNKYDQAGDMLLNQIIAQKQALQQQQLQEQQQPDELQLPVSLRSGEGLDHPCSCQNNQRRFSMPASMPYYHGNHDNYNDNEYDNDDFYTSLGMPYSRPSHHFPQIRNNRRQNDFGFDFDFSSNPLLYQQQGYQYPYLNSLPSHHRMHNYDFDDDIYQYQPPQLYPRHIPPRRPLRPYNDLPHPYRRQGYRGHLPAFPM